VSIPSQVAGDGTGGLRLDTDSDAADLAAYLSRLVRYDPGAVVRLRADGPVLGVFSQPPFGVIALRGTRLAKPATVDLTLPAKLLLDRLGADAALELASPVTGPAWTGLLPPRAGWQRQAGAPATALADAVATGVAEFRARCDELPEPDRTRARMDAIAEEVWTRPVLAGLPLRAAHAAQALGFLASAGEASVHRTARWLRLDAPRGTVAVRLGSSLSLRVV
jgi:hypothetical protein